MDLPQAEEATPGTSTRGQRSSMKRTISSRLDYGSGRHGAGACYEPASASRLPSTSTVLARRRRRRATSAILSSLAVLIVLVAVLWLAFSSPHVYSRVHEPCLTPSCRLYMKRLEASLDPGKDPCEDFYAFVCSRWTPVAGGRSFLEDATLSFQETVMAQASTSEAPKSGQSSFEKAVKFFQACINNADPGTNYLKSFLRKSGLLWPAVDTRSDPLDILLKLSLNWRCPVFFYIYMSKSRPDGHSLQLFESFMGVDFNAFIDEHRSQQTNTGIVCELYNALRYSALRSAHESKSNGSISCEKIAEVQSRLLKRLEGNTDDYSSAYSSVYEFASNATPGISGDRWVDAISKYSSWRTAVHRTTPVDVGNVGYMKALATILADTSKEELLLFIGLTTVQVVGRFINSRVAALVYPGELSAAEKQHAAVCYHMTDVAIPGALSMSPSTYLFEGHRVRKVTEVANEVLASSMQRLRRSAWLGKNSKDIISKKVAGARPVFDGLNLEAVVTKTVVPDMSSSFLDNMMNLPSDYWTHFHRHFKLNGSRSIWSNPWLQVSSSKGPLELVIPDVYMLKLLFPDDAYESIYYASVGSLLARQISTAHDLRGRTVDSNGTESHWLTPEETAKQDILIECLVQAFEASHNGSEVITAEDKSALYVAWDSLSPLLKALRSSPGFNARNPSSLHYTPLQLFFISLCFTMCAHPGDNIARFSEASWCNFPLSLSETFKETFQCLDGSPMHSRVPCYPDSLYPEEV